MKKIEEKNTNAPANCGNTMLAAGILKPILFSTDMVQAILRGEKTQTRRKIKHKNIIEDVRLVMKCVENERDWDKYILTDEFGEDFLINPKYKIGDILWVRETWHPKRHNMPTGWKYEYKATAKDDGNPTDEPWKPSIFMPKDACRIFLKITRVRVERLQDITKEDAIAEGIESIRQLARTFYKLYYGNKKFDYDESPIVSYFSLWDKINGEGSFLKNPWVFVYEFERTECPYA